MSRRRIFLAAPCTAALACLALAGGAAAEPPLGQIDLLAGTVAGYSHGPSTTAQLSGPTGVASTGDGGFLIADTLNGKVRRVDAGGTITTVAGNGND